MTTDRIVKQTLLHAPRERVWRAISDAAEFGSWFGMALDGPFVAGTRVKARIVPTRVDPEVAKLQAPYAGTDFEIVVERVEPLQALAFRWHPYAVEAGMNYAPEPMTLVTFELEDRPGGTLLTITESGFDRIPLARRAAAFKSNEGGWEMQTRLISKHLAQPTPAR